MTDDMPARRALLAASGAAFVAAAAAEPAIAQSFCAPKASERLWSARYVAQKGAIPVAVYRRRARAPRRANDPAPILLLGHGSSFSALTTFDLTVPGAGDYSMMNVFARLGFDVWALDFEGYGRTPSSGGNSDLEVTLADLDAVVALIERETGKRRMHLYGQSSGSLRMGAYAMAHPDRVDRLILESFSWTGENAPTLIERRRNIEAYRASPRRNRDREAIRSIFTRDHLEATDPRIIDAVIAAELPYGSTVPSGAYLDTSTRLPLVDPAKLNFPVMVVRGQWDGIATVDDLLNFYRRLPNPDRQFIEIAGAAHGIILGLRRESLWRSLAAFLPTPAAT